MRTLPTLLLTLLLLSLPLAAKAEVDPPAITTSGESTVYVTPDRVIITLGVQTADADLDKAKAQNEAAAASLVKAVKALGVEQGDIGVDRLNVSLHYRGSSFNNQIDSYIVQRTYAVTLKDVKQFEPLIDAALKNGANQIQNVEFRSTELRKYRDQARTMAIRAAREKALDLAKALDTTIGKPLTISESGGGYYGNNYASNRQNSIQISPAGPDASDSLPLGRIAISATVTVKFELK